MPGYSRATTRKRGYGDVPCGSIPPSLMGCSSRHATIRRS